MLEHNASAPGVYAAPGLHRGAHCAHALGGRRRASILASRSMTRHASFKTLSSTTSRSPLDMRLWKLTTLNLPRSDSGVAGGGSRSCSRTVSWLPITTTVSPSFLRRALDPQKRRIVHASQEDDVARVCTCNSGQEVPPEQESLCLAVPSQVGASCQSRSTS